MTASGWWYKIQMRRQVVLEVGEILSPNLLYRIHTLLAQASYSLSLSLSLSHSLAMIASYFFTCPALIMAVV